MRTQRTARTARASITGLMAIAAYVGAVACSTGDATHSSSGPAGAPSADPTACPTPPGLPTPPASFGEGFVDRSAPIAASPPYVVDLGDGTKGRQPQITVAFFGDTDGDGRQEVVVPPNTYPYDANAHTLLAPGSTPMITGSTLMGALDLDGDGIADLLSRQGEADIAWGLGGGKFTTAGRLDPNETLQPGEDRTAYLDDIDADGWLDVLIGVGCCSADCRAMHPMLRTGLRTYADSASLVDETIAAKPAAVFVARFATGETVLGQMGWSCVDQNKAPAFYRAVTTTADGYPSFEPFDPIPAVNAIALGGPGASLASTSPMGAALGDLDGDGALDLGAMTNPVHAILAGGPTWPFVDRSTCTGFAVLLPAQGKNPMLPWGAAFLDLDRDGRLDAVMAHGNDFGGFFDPTHFTGPQHSSAFYNRGQFHFADITAATGLGRPGQWMTLAVGDVDADGDADLIIGGQGELPRFYENRIDAGNHGLSIRLHGTTSNHLGVGARVDVPAIGTVPAQHLYAGGVASPYAISEPLVFVALGPATELGSLQITWPSGTVQDVVGLQAGKLFDVVEPQVLAIVPNGRHVPADGHSKATIQVTPRGTDGAPREGTVALRVVAGAGAIAAPTRSGASWVFPIVAPSAKGSTVFEARIDGAAVAVRPRIFWD